MSMKPVPTLWSGEMTVCATSRLVTTWWSTLAAQKSVYQTASVLRECSKRTENV